MKNRIKGLVGYLLIIFGLLIPLLGFFPMSLNNFRAEKSYEAFRKAQAEKTTDQKLEDQIKAYNEDLKNQDNLTAVDPFTAEGYKGTYDLENRDPDEIFSYLIIPKLDLIRPIYLDASYDHLAKGIAQIDKTSLPVGGVGTRSVLAGHRGWYNDVMFLYLEELEEGDLFFIDDGTKMLTYEVATKEVIGPSDWEKLKAEPEKDMVTLLTCHPFGPPRPYRLLVNGERLDSETQVEEEKAPKIEEIKTEKIQMTPSDKTKKMNGLIYGITGLLIILLLITLGKFIGFIKRVKKEENKK